MKLTKDATNETNGNKLKMQAKCATNATNQCDKHQQTVANKPKHANNGGGQADPMPAGGRTEPMPAGGRADFGACEI